MQRGFPFRTSLFGLALLVLSACSTISTYDQTAYKNATDAKVDTLALMSKAATSSYASQDAAISSLKLELEKAYEYDKGRPLNRISIEQWDTLKGPDSILSRFLARWETSGTHLSPAFVDDKKDHVAREFDAIIQLESGKIKTPPATTP